jgi:magnesium-transporting ATPase (P-type)
MDRFRPRRFVSFSLALCFSGAAFSGAVLFLRPEGSLARRMGWTCLGLDKAQWESVHVTLTALFLVFAAAHIRYNWKTFVSYLRERSGTLRSALFELLAAVLLFTASVSLAVLNLPPASWFLHQRSEFKHRGADCRAAQQVSGAGWMTIGELAKGGELPAGELLARLSEIGLKDPDTAMTLGEAAARCGISPIALYERLMDR